MCSLIPPPWLYCRIYPGTNNRKTSLISLFFLTFFFFFLFPNVESHLPKSQEAGSQALATSHCIYSNYPLFPGHMVPATRPGSNNWQIPKGCHFVLVHGCPGGANITRETRALKGGPVHLLNNSSPLGARCYGVYLLIIMNLGAR